MIKEALFCDGTEGYVMPPEPEPGQNVTLSFRVSARDEVQVSLVTEQKKYPMERNVTRGEFCYFSVDYQLTEEALSYYFEIRQEDEICYFGRWGVTDRPMEEYNFCIVPGFCTPNWAKGAVIYQIYTDRFFNGNRDSDVQTGEYVYLGRPSVKVDDWNKVPEPHDVGCFYGGDLDGVREKLDYLKKLGVEVLYFNPLFVSPSNHKYDTQDYDYIDPHYTKIMEDGGELLKPGDQDNRHAEKYIRRTTSLANLEESNRFFAEFTEELHKRGMRIILDGVFNHCGSFHQWLDREEIYDCSGRDTRGAYLYGDSPYRDYFRFERNGDSDWPHNGSYDGWWGHPTLPKLHYEASQELENYILGVGAKWVSPPYNADGWRIDVGADLGYSREYNHLFWKKFRKAVKDANPEAIILAEHYGDVKDWLMGDQWDTVMNYSAFMEPVSWFLTGMEKHSDERRSERCGDENFFIHSMKHHMSRMTYPSLLTAMNQLSNHDHSRFLTRTNHKVGRSEILGSHEADIGINPAVFREAVVMQMTWIGAPGVYYGDEAGVCGFTDPDNRRTYPWGKENRELIEFHEDMIRIHRENNSLRIGAFVFLKASRNVISYGRFYNKESIVVIVNNGEEREEVTVPVWIAEVPGTGYMFRMIYSYDRGYTSEYEEYIVENGEIVANMGAYSALVLKYQGS